MCNLSSSRCGLVSKFQPRPRPWPWERRLLLPLARCRTRSSHGRRSAHAPRCRRRLRPRRLRLRRQREPTTAAAPPLRPRALERLIHYPLSRRTTILADGYPIMSGSGSLISPVTRAYSKRQRLRWRGRSQVTHWPLCLCLVSVPGATRPNSERRCLPHCKPFTAASLFSYSPLSTAYSATTLVCNLTLQQFSTAR